MGGRHQQELFLILAMARLSILASTGFVGQGGTEAARLSSEQYEVAMMQFQLLTEIPRNHIALMSLNQSTRWTSFPSQLATTAPPTSAIFCVHGDAGRRPHLVCQLSDNEIGQLR
jgi:hypothetical protein